MKGQPMNLYYVTPLGDVNMRTDNGPVLVAYSDELSAHGAATLAERLNRYGAEMTKVGRMVQTYEHEFTGERLTGPELDPSGSGHVPTHWRRIDAEWIAKEGNE